MKAEELQLVIAACESAGRKAHGPESPEAWASVGIAIELDGRGAGSAPSSTVMTPFGLCRALGSRGGRTRAWVSLEQMRKRYKQLKEKEAH